MPPLTHAAPPKATKALYEDLLSVSFPTEKEGWACGRWGTILHTTDGGTTWTHQDSGTDYTLSSLHFVDPKHGWAVGDEGIIIHTTDGGTTWTKQKSPVAYFLMGVHFATPQKGWIVSERTTILHTSNGGTTWQVQFKDRDYILKSVSFCDEKNGWAAGEYGYIYHTEDGGITWRHQAGEFGISEETGELVGGNFLFDIQAVDRKTAWAVGIDGYVTKTTDGGTTWTKIEAPIPKIALYSVAANTSGAIAIGGDGVFIWSQDQGRTWKKPDFTPSIRYGWIYGLAARGMNNFVTVGLDGAVYGSDTTKTPPVFVKAAY